MNRSEIVIRNCQVKSVEKLRILCETLDTMEKELGICSVLITVESCFICPDIDLDEIGDTPMERLVKGIVGKLRNIP